MIEAGWHTIPDRKPFRGTGGPGLYFEHLLGFDVNNQDTPDALGWELKWHTERTALVTLLHKSPDNAPDVIRALVRAHGKRDAKGRLSSRHTVRPRTSAAGQVFNVDYRDNQIVVRPKSARSTANSASAPAPRWSDQALIGAAGAKLRRLILVKGEKRTAAGVGERQIRPAGARGLVRGGGGA